MILMHTDSHPVKISISLMSLIVCALYLTACAHNPNPVEIKCIEYRAAFDIGSGTTKMKVAKIDKCNHKNIEIVISVPT